MPVLPSIVPPLEDDYENVNVTPAPTTMAQKADNDWVGRTRGGSPMTGVSTMPVEDNLDTALYVMPGSGNPEPAWPSLSNRDRIPPRVPMVQKECYFPAKRSTNTPSPISGSRTAHDTTEGYNDYNIYIQGMDRLNSEGDVDVERKFSEVGHVGHISHAGHVGHKQLGRIQSREVTRSSPITRSVALGHNITHHTRFDTGVRYGIDPSVRNRRKAPQPLQDSEVLNRQGTEDIPEKTVAITTWREQVARETTPIETMSIHYMGLEDYAVAERTLTEVDSNVQSAQRTLHEIARSDSMGSTRPVDEPSKDIINPTTTGSEESTPASPMEPEVCYSCTSRFVKSMILSSLLTHLHRPRKHLATFHQHAPYLPIHVTTRRFRVLLPRIGHRYRKPILVLLV